MWYLTFAISACFILSHDAKKIKLSQLWGDNLDPFIFTNFPLIVYVCHCVGIWGETEKQDWPGNVFRTTISENCNRWKEDSYCTFAYVSLEPREYTFINLETKENHLLSGVRVSLRLRQSNVIFYNFFDSSLSNSFCLIILRDYLWYFDPKFAISPIRDKIVKKKNSHKSWEETQHCNSCLTVKWKKLNTSQ